MTLYLLDAYALIYRAYYALIRSPRVNSKGQNTSAIFGFVGTLSEVLTQERPDLLAVAFDPAGPTFRHEAYSEYKAQREASPEDIRSAVPVIKELLRAWGIPVLEVAGFEADDVIGSAAKQAEALGYDVVMLTPDKDYAQLVSPHITMCRPSTGKKPMERLGPAEVCQKYGLERPEQVIDLLALMGDVADNIPGCPGVGEKTAAKLLAQFGSIERMLERTAEIKGALREKVEASAEAIRFSRMLTTIRTDVPLPYPIAELRQGEMDRAELRTIFEQLEFRSFVTRILGEESGAPAKPAPARGKTAEPLPSLFAEMTDAGAETPGGGTLQRLTDVPHTYELIENEDSAAQLVKKIMNAPCVAFDTETTSVDALRAELVGMSFCTEPGRAWYVSVPRETMAARRMVGIFRPVLESPTLLKVGQNLKYDMNVVARYGVELGGPLFDTMIAHYLVQPELRHGLDYLAEVYLHYQTIHIEELIGARGRGQRNMSDLAPQEVCDYACEDADVALRLREPLEQAMRECGVEQVFADIEMPLMPVLSRMERTGVRIDTAALRETGQLFEERLRTLEAEIHSLAGEPFSITSPRQVGEVLFGKLKLSEKVRRTKTGQYATSEDVLESLRHRHPIVEKILQHRALKKLLGTYIEALPRLINPETGRIHTSLNQTVTATGRLSSSSPNLQNIPVRGEDGREIRKCFVADEGEVFFSADYSQIELRLMAHLSADPGMVHDFQQGRDIHAATAARIFHQGEAEPLQNVTRDERRKAKTANFGIIYGISAFGLAERMDVSRTEAKSLIDSYFNTYPRVRQYISESVERARERGWIETLFGRRRYLPDIASRNAVVRGYAERNAVNAPIQGTAADIIKVAMVRIDRRLRQEGLKAKMLLQVHDELNFSVPPEELDRLRDLVLEEMEHACEPTVKLSVPLTADCGTGGNWLEAH